MNKSPSPSLKPLVVFAHGKESGPWGSKIVFLADIAKQLGAEVLSPDYSGMDNPDHRVAQLLALPELQSKNYSSLLLVGSSMGGYVSVVASQTLKPHGLFLLAPAIGIAGYPLQQSTIGCDEVEIVMGWNDDIIPVSNVVHFASQHKARLHCLHSDHRLNSALPDIGAIFKEFLRRVLKTHPIQYEN